MKHFLLLFLAFVLCDFLAAAQPNPADVAEAILQGDLNLNTLKQLTPKEINEAILEGEQNLNNLKDKDFPLPLGFKRSFANYSITIAVAAVSDESTADNVQISTKFRFPGTEEELYFASENVTLAEFGRLDFSKARLYLISEHHIKLSDQITLVVGGEGQGKNCFVEWDCNGFKSVSLGVQVQLDPTVFIAMDGKPIRCNTVIRASDLDDILIQLSLPAFKLSYTQDFVYTLTDVTLDMSSTHNAANFALPQGHQLLSAGQPELWQGIYAKTIVVQLPPMLSPNATAPLVLRGEHVIIDDYGFSATLFGEINSPMTGSDAWKISVAKAGIEVFQNKLKGGFITGGMMFSALDNKHLSYSAEVSTKNDKLCYAFRVTLDDAADFKLISTLELALTKDSYISISAVEGQGLVAEANLNGYASVSDIDSKTSIPKLRFERLQLSSQAPYYTGGYFALESEEPMKMAGLPINLSEVSLGFGDLNAAFGLNLRIALMGSGDEKGISAGGGLKFKVAKTPDWQWKLEGVDINSINLRASYSAFDFDGTIAIYKNDAVYGTGFFGDVTLTIKALPAPIEAGCRFGEMPAAENHPKFNYWFARVGVPVNIPVGTGIMITQIGGAVYQKMSPRENGSAVYLPDYRTAFGFKASTKLATFAGENLLSIGAEFEMTFNNSLGVRSVAFNGSGAFLAGVAPKASFGGLSEAAKFDKVREESAKAAAQVTAAPIGVSLKSSYNVETKTFNAQLDAGINLSPILEGRGQSVIFSSPNTWYFYFGKPSSPVQVNILNFVKANSYFMVGNQMEPLPNIPAAARNVAGKVKRVSTSDPAFSAGSGVAFGASMSVDAGFDLSVIYAQLGIGAGFDILLKSYPGVGCSNTGKLVGMNGWYAQGQSYAYLQGVLGVKFKRSRFDILNISAAAILEAKAPNPTWISGNVSARYKILGGLVKGSASLDFEVGEVCQMQRVGSPLGDISFIGDMKPDDSETAVSVFALPQIAFNTTIGEAFDVEGFGGAVSKYRVTLDEINFEGETSGVQKGEFKFNDQQDVAAFYTKELLPGQEKMKLSVTVRVEEFANGQWRTLKNDDGTDMTEHKQITFTTGLRPNHIPDENVDYSYPVRNQFNFYKNEYTSGYMALTHNFGYLFATQEGDKQYRTKARFTSGNKTVEADVSYNSGDNQVSIPIPDGLELASVYKLQLVRQQVVANTNVDRNVERSEVALSSADGNDASLQQNTLHGTVSGEGQSVIYQTAFRTSRYATFGAKAAAAPRPTVMYSVHSDTKSSLLALDFNMEESYDAFEVNGMEVDQFSLIQAEGVGNEDWIRNYAAGKMYNLTEIRNNSSAFLGRNTNEMGLTPLKKSVYIDDLSNRVTLTEADLSRSTIDKKEGKVRIAYFVPHFIQKDYYMAKNYVANRYRDQSIPSDLAPLLESGGLKDISQDYYKVRLNYVLPGKKTVTSSHEYTIDYHIR